ncbi:MAG: ATP-binding protein [Lachnospiraceae bacterium]|nr:ATP-binding protein [Lachnospiraceae bacterium]
MFRGRSRELTELNERFLMNTKQFGIIYGRRRIGKSALIERFMKDKPGLLFQAKVDNSYGNLRSFSYAVDKLTGLPTGFVFSSWEEALDAVVKHFKGKRFILTIDEYPYIVSQDASFSSILQDFFDHAPENCFLLLSGSNVSFLEKELTHEKSPLYKRKTFEMPLGPLEYEEAILFLEKYSIEDKIGFLSIMGKYPYYLSAIDDGRGFEWNLKKLLFNEYGSFFSLPDQVLSNSTNAQDVYNAILQSISLRHRKPGDISKDIHEENAKVSKYLDTLTGIGIVEKRSSFMGNKKTNYYEISDPMIRFWYRIVFRDQERIRINPDGVYAEAKDEIKDYINHGFEEVCHYYMESLNKNGRLPAIFPQIKNYTADNSVLGRSVEIDGVAEAGNELIIMDCKYRNKSYSKAVFEHLLESSSVFSERYHKHYYLFSRSGFADDMSDISEAVKLTAEDMF